MGPLWDCEEVSTKSCEQVKAKTYISNDIIAGAVGIVVPLEGDLVSAVGADGLGGLDVGDVALNVLGGNGAVVGGRVDVSAGLVTDTLVLSVHENIPDAIDVQISMCASSPSQRAAYVVWAKAPPARARARIEDFILKVRV
jgi:hypothetical protein